MTLTLIALLPASAGLAACGGVPGNAVAEVDGESIEKSQFDAWMSVAAKAGGQSSGVVPKPPEYTECIADKRKAQPQPAKGEQPVDDKQLKDQCRQEYEAIRDRVMQLLVNAEWIEGEAKEQNVTVSDAEVRKAFETQKKQNFPKEADYENFLKQSGQTEEQLLSQVRTGELARKISEKVVEGKDKVTDAEISAYYAKNKARFAQPETRDAHVVLARTEARARQAMRRSRAAARGRASPSATRSTRPARRRAVRCAGWPGAPRTRASTPRCSPRARARSSGR